MAGELAKDQCLVPRFEQLVHHLAKDLQLARRYLAGRVNQLGIAAGPAQPHDLGKNLQMPPGLGLAALNVLQSLLTDGLVEGHFRLLHLHPQGDFGARRQLVQDLRLDPAEHERPDQLFELAPSGAVAVLFNRNAEAGVELLVGAQQAGVDEIEKVPQLAEMIFYRRASSDQAELGLQTHRGFGTLGGRILDGLRLVQNYGLPRHRLQQLYFLLEQGETGDENVAFAKVFDHLLAVVRIGQAAHGQCGGETGRLLLPVHANRSRRNDQGRAVLGPIEDHCQRLKRLAETHVVGQAAAHAEMRQPRHPDKALDLVIAQLGLQSGRHLRDEILHKFNPGKLLLPALVGLRIGLPGEVVQGQGGERMDADFLLAALAFAARLAEAEQLFQAAAELLRQGEELAFAERDEAAAGLAHLVQERFQVNDFVLIHLHMAGQSKPVLLAGADVEIELTDARLFAHGQLLALWPFQHRPVADFLQLQQGLQAFFRVEQMPLAVVLLGQVDGKIENRAALLNLAGFLLLQHQVAAGLHPPSADLGHQIGHAHARLEIRPFARERLDKHLQPEASAVGNDVDMNGRICLDNLHVLFRAAHVNRGMHGHEGGHIADGTQNLAACRRRVAFAARADDSGHPPVLVVDLHHSEAGRSLLPDCHPALADFLQEMDEEEAILLLNHQLRLTGHDFHRHIAGTLQKNMRVADQRGQGLVHVEVAAAIAGVGIADLTQGSADFRVLLGEEIKIIGRVEQAVEADALAFAPLTARLFLLLLGRQGQFAVGKFHGPRKTAGLLRLSGPACDADQFL